MNEKDLNRIIVSSLSNLGFAHKISDDAQNFMGTSKKPFDYFAVNPHYSIYGESKLIKGVYAFNFNKIEDHQLENLMAIYGSLVERRESDKTYPVISLGLWESRKFFYVLFFHINAILDAKSQNINSLKKPILERIIKDGKYLQIKTNNILYIENLKEKIIMNLHPYLTGS